MLFKNQDCCKCRVIVILRQCDAYRAFCDKNSTSSSSRSIESSPMILWAIERVPFLFSMEELAMMTPVGTVSEHGLTFSTCSPIKNNDLYLPVKMLHPFVISNQ